VPALLSRLIASLAHEVLLRPTADPTFPDECVVCRAPSPGHAVWYVARDGLEGHAFWAGWLRRRVPACRGCGRRLQIGLVWGFVRVLVVGLGSMALSAWWLHPYFAEEATLGLVCFGITCLCLLVAAVWERTHLPPFSIELDGSGATYSFRDRDQAERFARANGIDGLSRGGVRLSGAARSAAPASPAGRSAPRS